MWIMSNFNNKDLKEETTIKGLWEELLLMTKVGELSLVPPLYCLCCLLNIVWLDRTSLEPGSSARLWFLDPQSAGPTTRSEVCWRKGARLGLWAFPVSSPVSHWCCSQAFCPLHNPNHPLLQSQQAHQSLIFHASGPAREVCSQGQVGGRRGEGRLKRPECQHLSPGRVLGSGQ